jgi:transcriptional regulator with XRE-family HTH domain
MPRAAVRRAWLSAWAALVCQRVAHVHPPSRGPYGYSEVADAINASSDGKGISASAIQQLRTGTKKNPTMHTINALAQFFGVTPNYFFIDEVATRTAAEIELLTALRDNGIRQLALRASGLSAASLQMLKAVIEQTRRLEGLSQQ